MKQKLQTLRARVACAALMAAPMLASAQTAPTTAEEAITQGKATVIAIIAVGGLAMVLVALASVGWGVGVKFIKRLRPSA